MQSKSNLLLFLIGLGVETQIHFFGSVGISEIAVFLVAPFVFFRDFQRLRSDGFMPFIALTILTCIGCMVSARINGLPLVLALKGFASPYAMVAFCVVFHGLLRNNYGGLKWLLLGLFISSIVCIFVFQPETFTVRNGVREEGDAAVAAVVGYALFWSSLVASILKLPITCAYLRTPTVYAVVAMIISAVVALLFSSGSGRASALICLSSSFLLYVGGKSRSKMMSFGRNFFMWCAVGVLLGGAFKATYSYLAMAGTLGENAQKKYYAQTRTGTSALKMLMSGRMEFFCGMIAAFEHPIFGLGYKAVDHQGYVADYLQKYGSQEDYEYHINNVRAARRDGYELLIPGHSYMASFWLYFGIFGLILWLYVLWLCVQYFRRYSVAIPQWYGYACVSIPANVWAIFFSAFGGRVHATLLVVCMLFAKAVREDRLHLPWNMEMEARDYD